MNYETEIVGTEHADELSIVQPSYNPFEWLSGDQAKAVKDVQISDTLNLDRDINFY